jgi:DnaJ-class molecular chaperone
MEQDPYSVLGVSKTATQEEIRNAYRKLAKSLHPDLNPGNKEAERKFKEIAAAYEIIGDEKKRKEFDAGPKPGEGFEFRQRPGGPFSGGQGQERHFYYETQGGPGEEGGFYSQGFNFEDLFGESYGYRRAQRGPRKGDDEIYRMEIDLKDAAEGGEKDITLPSGKRLRVKIPPGVTDGTRLRFAGQGGPGVQGGPTGDVYVELTIRESTLFRRVGTGHGLDLETELPITLSEALAGTSVRAPTLTGHVMLTIPAGSNNGARLRLRGKGLPERGNPSTRGDLYVKLRVILPAVVSEELKNAAIENEKRNPYNPREERPHAA